MKTLKNLILIIAAAAVCVSCLELGGKKDDPIEDEPEPVDYSYITDDYIADKFAVIVAQCNALDDYLANVKGAKAIEISSHSEFLEKLWFNLYDEILAVNYTLDKYMYDADKPGKKAGALLLIRAFCNYKLTTFWGPVPIFDVFEADMLKSMPNSAADEIYYFILDDCYRGQDYIGAPVYLDKAASEKAGIFGFSSYVANVMIAKTAILMTQRPDFPRAHDSFQNLINSGVFSLSDSNPGAGPVDPEVIWWTPGADLSGNPTEDMVPVFNYADVLLGDAEVVFRLGNVVECVDKYQRINTWLDPAFELAPEVYDWDSFLPKIQALHEKLSAYTTGEKFLNMRRWGTADKAQGLSSGVSLLPVPYKYLAENPNALQNPGW